MGALSHSISFLLHHKTITMLTLLLLLFWRCDYALTHGVFSSTQNQDRQFSLPFPIGWCASSHAVSLQFCQGLGSLRNSNLCVCVCLLFAFPLWCPAFIYFILMPWGFGRKFIVVQQMPYFGQQVGFWGICSSLWVFVCFQFFPLCRSFLPGQ